MKLAYLLDQLIDEDSHAANAMLQPVQILHAVLRRDMELLLNTRAPGLKELSAWPAAMQSVMNYGLSDLMSTHLNQLSEQQQFCTSLATLIERFEPRLQEVCVILLPLTLSASRTLKIRITGSLTTALLTDTLIFDSTLQPLTRQFKMIEKL